MTRYPDPDRRLDHEPRGLTVAGLMAAVAIGAGLGLLVVQLYMGVEPGLQGNGTVLVLAGGAGLAGGRLGRFLDDGREVG